VLEIMGDYRWFDGSFSVSNKELRYSRAVLKQPLASMLYLHGGGTGCRARAAYLLHALAEAGISTFAFDFAGQGESPGQLRDQSLESRVEEAFGAIKFMGESAPLMIMGNSMGGYVAAELVTRVNASGLILSVPGLYARDAYTVPFGPEFTEILRTPFSYRTSRVLASLRSFRGNATLISAGKDRVIPSEVIRLYKKALQNARLRTLHFTEAPHQIHEWAPVKQEVVASIVAQIKSAIKSDKR
jgi:uncharacterized protein